MACTLESVRNSLIRQEDTIVFGFLERAKYPRNALAYDASVVGGVSLVECFVRESEAVHAKAGRYRNPEEIPFFPDTLPEPLVSLYDYPQVLHPPAASVDISKRVWDLYFEKLLPLFTVEGDDGNYACTAASDLACLQALSRRIHFGKFVAEVKFKEAPEDYSALIGTQDSDALMELLTFESVEKAVMKRVEKKAMTFGENVMLDCNTTTTKQDDKTRYKVDPSLFSRLYGEWIIPMTKEVQVKYLLRRLD